MSYLVGSFYLKKVFDPILALLHEAHNPFDPLPRDQLLHDVLE